MFVFSIKNKSNNKEFIGAALKENSKEAVYNKYKHHKLNDELYNDLNKYKAKDFKVSVLYQTDSLERLESMEEFYIKKNNSLSPNGYNTDTGYKIL